MENTEKNGKGTSVTGGAWWQGSVLAFGEISTWIVVPVVLALVVGKWLDAKYGTAPWLFIILAVFGFLITLFGIWRSVKRFAEKVKKEEKRSKENIHKDL